MYSGSIFKMKLGISDNSCRMSPTTNLIVKHFCGPLAHSKLTSMFQYTYNLLAIEQLTNDHFKDLDFSFPWQYLKLDHVSCFNTFAAQIVDSCHQCFHLNS